MKTLGKLGYLSLRNLNPVVKFLTLSDVLIISGWGLSSPIFAIFIVDKIPGSSVEVVGIATTIYLLTKSLAQVPAGYILDKIKGEKDDFLAMLVGSVLFSFIPLLYLMIDAPWQLYVIQFFHGLVAAITFPSWFAIFSRHLDKDKEGMEWGVYTTLVDLGGAGTAAIGGFIAATLGFAYLFITVSILSLLGSLTLLFVHDKMRKPKINAGRK